MDIPLKSDFSGNPDSSVPIASTASAGKPIISDSKFRELMTQVAAGSYDAAWDLLAVYGPHVRRAVRRSISRDLQSKFDSMDFVQAVWASFFASRARNDEFQTPESLIAFLATVARNKVVEEFRRRTQTAKFDVSREKPLATADKVPSADPTPSQVAMARECWSQLLAGEPRQRQEIVKMKFAGELNEAIAAKLGINEKTVRRAIEHILERLDS